nr:KrmK [uncultured bacterium]
MTAFPVSCEHDEYFFMRVLQMSECCFWGALSAVIAAIEATKFGCLEEAMAHMAQALEFLDLLQPITQVLKTIPPEHFWAFRDATDGSSAIQSRWFHLLHIYLHGLDERKIAIFADIPEISDLIHYGKPGFVSLRSLLRGFAGQPPPELEAFADMASQLDASLYAYRCVHLGIVHRFLPPDAKQGTGGTSGIPYLRKHLTRRLWPLESEYPQPDLEELNAIDMFQPLVGVGN